MAGREVAGRSGANRADSPAMGSTFNHRDCAAVTCSTLSQRTFV